MIDELNKTAASIESVILTVPYISFRIEDGKKEILMSSKDFDKIIEEVDPILILAWPFTGGFYTVERSILIGTVRVFALYEV